MSEIVASRGIIRHLPGPVVGWLRTAYSVYRLWLGRKLIAQLVEFNNSMSPGQPLSRLDAFLICKVSYRLNVDLWNMLLPKTAEEITRYYEKCPWYLFELVYWHTEPEQRRFRKQVARLAHGKVLDYGAGIGDLALDLARKGLDVTYAEVKSRSSEFAAELFQKNGMDVRVLDLSGGGTQLMDQYDTIVCIDVIEHVPSAQETLELLAGHLKAGGVMIITQLDYSSGSDGNPTHFPLRFDVERLMNSLGLVRHQRHSWLWNKQGHGEART